MATSLVDRINNTGQKSIATKAIDTNWPLWGYSGLDSKNRDFTYSEYGVAQASQFVVEIDSALQVWEQWLDGLVWDIKDLSTGKVLLSSNVRVLPEREPGARFLRAVQNYRKQFFHSYWKSLVTSDWVVGETYLYRVPNLGNIPTDLQWLNPLSTEPDIRQGAIYGYRYSANNAATIGYTIPANMVAFRMLRRNLFDDLRGKSPILSIIDESNLSRNVKRAFRNYFRNGMTLGGVMMPENAEAEMTPREHEIAQDTIRRTLSGTDNAHKWAILRRRMFIEQFQSKDASKDLDALALLRDPIRMALGVPEELSGLTGGKTYENIEEAQRAFWRMRGIPYAQDIAEFHNNQIVPYFEPGAKIYIEPNTSKYEIEDPDVVSQDVNTGIIDLTEAASKRGYEPDSDLKGIRIIGGQPYSKERLLKVANGDTPEAEPITLAPTLSPPAPIVPENTPTESPAPPPPVNMITVEKAVHKHIIFDDHHVGIEPFVPAQETALDELEAWRKVATKSNKSAARFDPHWLRGDIADSLLQSLETASDNKAIHGYFNEAKTVLENHQKTIQATRLDFENDFDELLKRARTEKFGRVQWASAMRSIIRRYGTRAFQDGLVVGGVLDGNLSEEDSNTVAELYTTASSYVTKLGNELYKGDGISDAVADNKAAIWWNRTMQVFYDSGLLSADANGMYEFAGDDGEESCATCTRLKGQRHRLKDWARKGLRPKVDGDQFDCGGFQCEHKLVKVKSTARGKW